jgi:hypothetical protein
VAGKINSDVKTALDGGEAVFQIVSGTGKQEIAGHPMLLQCAQAPLLKQIPIEDPVLIHSEFL